jgi:parallel beta-helix repeat protein
MHSAPTGSGVAALEVWAGGVLANKSCSISNNDVEGAALGISLADCANGLVEGNSVRNFLSYGLEMPGGLNGGIVGNSVDGQNNAVGQDGILVDGNAPSVNRIVGNSIVNLSGRAIYTTGSNIVVSGNTIANCSGIGVEINGGDFVSITGNLVDVTAGATGQGVWVIESSSVSVSGNIVRAGASANAIQCVALTGATRNHIVVIGNFASGSNDILMTGSHFGDDIIIGPNNNGLGGYIAIDFANLLFVEFSSNDPNSFAPWVGIGSIFLRKGGAVGQQLAVKQATAGPSWAYVNMTQRIEVTITAAQLAAAAKPVLVAALATARWKVRSIKLTGITGLSGGGGDRNVRIQDNSGTTIWSTLTAAAVQGTTPLRWGDAGAPFASGAALTAESVAGEALVATYAAGTTDYTAGSITLIVEYERTT